MTFLYKTSNTPLSISFFHHHIKQVQLSLNLHFNPNYDQSKALLQNKRLTSKTPNNLPTKSHHHCFKQISQNVCRHLRLLDRPRLQACAQQTPHRIPNPPRTPHVLRHSSRARPRLREAQFLHLLICAQDVQLVLGEQEGL
jgi:hypothetical protein